MRARRRAKLAALLVGAVAVPVGLVVGTAGTASAGVPCGGPIPSDIDHTAYKQSGDGGLERIGSHIECLSTGVAGVGDTLDYYCFTTNSEGTTWTYLRNATDGTSGWVRDDHLSDQGSGYLC